MRMLPSLGEMSEANKFVEELPSGGHYNPDCEMDYLRRLGEALTVINKLRLEEIPFVVSEKGYNRIVDQLVRQQRHK